MKRTRKAKGKAKHKGYPQESSGNQYDSDSKINPMTDLNFLSEIP